MSKSCKIIRFKKKPPSSLVVSYIHTYIRVCVPCTCICHPRFPSSIPAPCNSKSQQNKGTNPTTRTNRGSVSHLSHITFLTPQKGSKGEGGREGPPHLTSPHLTSAKISC
ncbi:hypothetical protein DM02DRAFT_183686 [Periconia macrospinosa]|uniref:Uncharacterized protein n=1 Tax=Periconia macrospinosa TaxID=97972 RepID=A0A2V1D9A0_9PLEO|nr:hypothetical protein DM02DRAFT_183686 [Periconia macrospinosa]